MAFHERNPHVFEALVALAGEARSHGATKLGIKQLWEVMRWQRHDYRTDDDGAMFRLSNDYHSRYARLIMRERPELSGIFELRTLRSPSALFVSTEPNPEQYRLFEEGFE